MNFPSNNPQQGKAAEPQGAHAEAPQAPGDGAARVAESGYTATHSCNGKQQGEGPPTFAVVWQGFDTLEVSYPGQVRKEASDELQRLKDLAQTLEARYQAFAQIKLGERVFQVGDRGGGRLFAFLLRHPDMRIAVASRNAKRVPLAVVTLQNQYLVSVGPERAEAEARSLLAELGKVEGSETVSRADLAADICTDEDIGRWSEDAWVTRASNIHRHTVDGMFTGWSIGLGADVSSRLYDKLFEILKKSNKTYFFDLWKEAGWFFGDPVKRYELQFRRTSLAQFGLKAVSDVLAARPGLWRYGTSDWTRLATPSGTDQTKVRWPLDPFWARVQAIPWEGKAATLSRYRPASNAPSDRVLARMFKAVATSVMARDGLATLEAAGEKLRTLLMGELQRVEQWEGASADDLLMEVVMLKRRKYCTGLNTK